MGAGKGKTRRTQSRNHALTGQQAIAHSLEKHYREKLLDVSVKAALLGVSLAAISVATAENPGSARAAQPAPITAAAPTEATGLASKFTAKASPSTVRAGHEAYIHASISGTYASCRLSGPLISSNVSPAEWQKIQWSWKVPVRAKSATWHLNVVCDKMSETITMRVIGRHTGLDRMITGKVRVQQDGTLLTEPAVPVGSTATLPAGPPTPVLPITEDPTLTAYAWAQANQDWEQEGAADINIFRNGYCTDEAETLRPDIVNYTMPVIWAEEIMAGDNVLPYPNWDATFWDTNAAQAGFQVGATPEAGAILVEHAADYNHATDPGHVAYVDSVNANGSLTVTEEHAPKLGVVTTDTIPASSMTGQNWDFIYDTTPEAPIIIPTPAAPTPPITAPTPPVTTPTPTPTTPPTSTGTSTGSGVGSGTGTSGSGTGTVSGTASGTVSGTGS